MAYLTRTEIEEIGFLQVGDNVYISEKASIYNPSKIKIGNNVRIDDFCLLSAGEGGIEIGNYVHIAAYSSLIGKGSIVLEDFSNISSRVSIYSSSDDYSGGSLTNPMIPDEYKNVISEDVYLGKHVIVGCGSIILPGVTLHNGVAVGALSLVDKDVEDFKICAGVPAKVIKDRKKDLETMEHRFVSSLS